MSFKKSKMMVIIISGCLCHFDTTKLGPNNGFYFGEKFLIYETLKSENHCSI